MDSEKLIERLYQHDKDYGEGRTQDFFRVCLDCKDAATALEQLQAENDRLKKEIQQMRWIPVEERLPEKQGEYIVFADGKVTTDIYIVCDKIERWLHYDGSLNEFYIDPYSSKPTREPPYPKVTHWMPLPQPPKEED